MHIKTGIFSLILSCFLLGGSLEALPRYWLIESDFTKLGKKELFEEEKKKDLEELKNFLRKKRRTLEVIGIEDLENPQYVFLMPLKDLSSLDLYPPIHQKELSALATCLHFQVFSLHEMLEDCSFRGTEALVETRPYLSYVLYDIDPGSQQSFEEHLLQISLKQSKKSPFAWNVWKVLLGADLPKYLICASFETKESMKETKLEELLEEAAFKDILRNRKGGWMKRENALSSGKKFKGGI